MLITIKIMAASGKTLILSAGKLSNTLSDISVVDSLLRNNMEILPCEIVDMITIKLTHRIGTTEDTQLIYFMITISRLFHACRAV